MPDVTTDDFIITGQVYDRFGGDSYTTYQYGGATYWTFGSAPNERWVDSDGDGWWDYGLRNDGYGHWSRWNGFRWDNGDTADEPLGDNLTLPPVEEVLVDSGWML